MFQTDSVGSRLLGAALVALVVAAVVWGIWILCAVILGSVGWLLSSVGNLLQRSMDWMAGARMGALWVALAIGGLLGCLLTFELIGLPERFPDRLRVPRHWNIPGLRRTEPDPEAARAGSANDSVR